MCIRDRAWNNQREPELLDERKQIIDPHTAYQMTSIMEGVVQRLSLIHISEPTRPY